VNDLTTTGGVASPIPNSTPLRLPLASAQTPTADGRWCRLGKMIGEMQLDPGEVAILQLVQQKKDRWGPTEWKKASNALQATKDPFRAKGRHFRFGLEGALNSWTFLELCRHFRDLCLARDGPSRMEAHRLKMVL
jgi:hypothetical protein